MTAGHRQDDLTLRTGPVAPLIVWLLALSVGVHAAIAAPEETETAPKTDADEATETSTGETDRQDKNAGEEKVAKAGQEGVPPAEAGAALPKPPEVESADRLGWTIKVRLPITGQTYRRVQRFVFNARDKAAAAQQRPVLIFELEVLPAHGEFGRGSEFGASYQLANFLSGPQLNEAVTVAYLPQTVQGHAVLVALACDEIIMASDARIGLAGIDEPNISDTIRLAYQEIADRRKDFPGEVAMALVDPGRDVLKVETELSTEFVSREGLQELKQRRAIRGTPEELIRAGEPGQFSGSEARQLGFIDYLASDFVGVARALGLPPKAIRIDPSLGDQWRAVRVDLTGPITASATDQVQRLIEDGIGRRDVNFVCLWIDSAGGSPTDSIRLANFLASLDPTRIRTAAYISEKALSDAALVALACDQVVMAPDAVLGGEGNGVFSEDDVQQISQTIRESLAPAKLRSWSLLAAIVDPDLDVFRCTRLDEVKYAEFFSEEELDELPDRDQWTKGELVTTAGAPLEVRGDRAVEFWLANHTAENFLEFKRLYGLESDPDLMEPGWADFLIRQLAAGPLAIILLMIGFAALYMELQMPGIGIGGFVATVCFVLFFWSRYLGGTAGWLEIMLFAVGVTFILLEVFVLPGFGIFGLGGGLMVLASLILASQTFVLPRNTYQFAQLQSTFLVLLGAAVGAVFAAVMLSRWLPGLSAPEMAQATGGHGAMAEYDDLVGARGTTTTQLTPSGKAQVEDRLLDVIADCELVELGTEITIVEVHGNRIFVRPVSEIS